MYADRVLSGSKGSIKDRLNGNSAVDFGRSRQITGKRQRQTDDKWKHDLYEDDEEPQVSRPKVGVSDLRLKLQRKESQQMHPSGKGSHVGVQDLREKLSGTMHSQPPNTDLHKAKAVAAAAKSIKKSTPSPEASIPDTKKVASSASRKKQKMSTDEAPPEALAVGDQSGHEHRFERFLRAFLVAQEAHATAHQQQAEDFAQFQTQALEVIGRVAQPAPVDVPIWEPDPNVIFEKFLKRGPPEFTGTYDAMVADDWIVRMEKIFRVFECSGRQRVQLAAYMFRGVAEDWWRTMQRPYEAIGDEVAWTAFKVDFLKKFIPAHVRERKLREFQTLVQGSMTVYQYELRFTQLSRFAEALLTSEAERVRRFVDGLREEIQLAMTCIELPTYEEALRRAYWAEEHLQRLEATRQQKRFRIAPIRQPPVIPQRQPF